MGSPWIKSFVLVSCMFSALVECSVHNYKFDVVVANVTRNCWTKPIITVNGQFPGPTLYVREDDTVLVQVVNHAKYNISIHWHGVKQLRNGWADGPSYITQCPIQPGQSYVYNFTLTGQRGTLWWHAHILWLRATVHGAIVILPKLGVPYPYPTPYKEEVLILGEWWNSDVEAVDDEALSSGAPPNISDTHTINSYPGPLSRCSSAGDFTLNVETGKTYMLRIISAALNDQLFFKIAGHQLTVVEVDATYVKPFKIDTIVVSPGQTTNVLVTADNPPGKFLIIASPFMDSVVPVDDVATSGLINYSGSPATSQISLTAPPPQNKTELFTKFATTLKSLNSQTYPCLVPSTVDHSLLFTVGVGLDACANCDNGVRFVAGINNITFQMPTTALLQAHYFNKSRGVFSEDFPGNPLIVFNYTGTPPNNTQTLKGTRLYRLAYNSTVQIVLQGTLYIAPETHPMHLHGFNFFEVGRGFGNFDPKQDPQRFNLVDPVERNTIGVPTGGWTAIRFRADNPGVWFFHCHLEVHTTWGLKMAFVVDNGNGPNESVLPPPSDLPTC